MYIEYVKITRSQARSHFRRGEQVYCKGKNGKFIELPLKRSHIFSYLDFHCATRDFRRSHGIKLISYYVNWWQHDDLKRWQESR